jgi:hypothetical protein
VPLDFVRGRLLKPLQKRQATGESQVEKLMKNRVGEFGFVAFFRRDYN